MQKTTDRLRFLVDFAGLDLDQARPGDWSNLRDDLRAFFGRVGDSNDIADLAGFVPEPKGDPARLSDGDLRSLQGDVRAILGAVSDSGSSGRPAMGPKMPITTTKRPMVLPSRPGGAVVIWVQGSVRDVFLEMTLQLLLLTRPLSPVLRCPECGTLFYRNRKQKYCKPACVRKANWRDYMQTTDGKVAKRRADKTRREKKRAAKKKG